MKYLQHKIALTVLLLCSAFSFLHAETINKQSVENLSPGLRGLLQQEMQALSVAMNRILIANTAGDNKKIAELATQIKDSFILRKSLSQSQMHELHTLLPTDFLKQDEAFHYNAGMLAHVAKNGKNELVGFYYTRLFEACAGCHQDHARHKFTNFSQAAENNRHEH
jgi:hypothetical protein